MTKRRLYVLQEMEIRETPRHEPVYFSISFYKANGELVFIPRAQTVGLKFSMKTHRARGVQAYDAQGFPYGHVTPVCIDNIREFNGEKVTI